jgi:glycosyltransferase involved in cell wall biosynthesis
MANHWAGSGWPVSLLTLDSPGPYFYPLHPDVNFSGLNLSGPLGSPLPGAFRMLKRLQVLRAGIKQTNPDVVISFNDAINVIVVFALAGAKIPVIVSERNDPHAHHLKRPWGILRPLAYRMAVRVTCQTEPALAFFPAAIRRRGMVIPNPVPKISIPSESKFNGNMPLPGKTLLAMGRLSPQKGFDLLLQAFAPLASRHPDWTLEIWGEGAERKSLEHQVSGLGLANQVRLPGLTKEPREIMRKADLFVLPSRYEGFPNVLCEAMACGLPVVSFDCPSGPAEIIRQGIDGLLVPAANTQALANALERLMSSDVERRKFGAMAVEVGDRFGLDRVMALWTDLVLEVASRQARMVKRLEPKNKTTFSVDG